MSTRRNALDCGLGVQLQDKLLLTSTSDDGQIFKT